jgi:hypothetical protein
MTSETNIQDPQDPREAIYQRERDLVASFPTIKSVESIEINGGFRIEVILKSGEREVIKAKSTRKPSVVQLYSFGINGNYRGDGLGYFFTFSKTVDAYYRDAHIKTFEVA